MRPKRSVMCAAKSSRTSGCLTKVNVTMPAAVSCRVVALNVEIAKVNATVVEGPPTRLGTLDVDRVVAQWRHTRSANPR